MPGVTPTSVPTPLLTDCEGLGPFCWLTQSGTKDVDPFRALATIVSNLIGVLTIVAGLWFIFQFVLGAFEWMSSAGDKAKLETARNRIVHALLGLIIVVVAIAIVGVVGKFLGLAILFNPDELVKQLNPAK